MDTIVFPVGSLLTVNQIVTFWIADMSTDKMNNSCLSTETTTIFDTKSDNTYMFKIVPIENVKEKLIDKVIKYDTEKEKDEEAENLNKRQKI